jgi:hypothetical protein
MSAPALDQGTIRRLLHYDPTTGAFTWLHRAEGPKRWNTRYAGKPAGYAWSPPNSQVTYRAIRVFDWPFLAHRLAWLYMTGEWPDAEVDHEDLDGLNNRWSNLRQATKAQNGANRVANKRSKTGVKGVSPSNTPGHLYRISFKGKHLGYCDDLNAGSAVYESAARAEFGEFVRTR